MRENDFYSFIPSDFGFWTWDLKSAPVATLAQC